MKGLTLGVMKMRRTEKWLRGKELALKKDIRLPLSLENEELYERLEKAGFWWNGKKKAWEKEATKPSPTIFADKKGKPTGIMRLRVMCHPAETKKLIAALSENPHFSVIELSEKTYANRHGAGERAYLTIRWDG
jgi:hypothetical protein